MSVLLRNTVCSPDSAEKDALSLWVSLTAGAEIPEQRETQKVWDEPITTHTFNTLLTSNGNISHRARLLAVSTKESGKWLDAYPIQSLGLHLSDLQLQIAIAIRLGAKVCEPYTCACGHAVAEDGLHPLSCKKGHSRYARHAMANDFLKRTLASAGIPSVLEPTGLSRSDGKRPDGMSLIPWRQGRSLLWDFTCTDTLAPSNLKHSTQRAGQAADIAERNKCAKYSHLCEQYSFTPIAIETMGCYGSSAHSFLKLLGKMLVDNTKEPRAATYMMQSLAIIIQMGNSNAVINSLPRGATLAGLSLL